MSENTNVVTTSSKKAAAAVVEAGPVVTDVVEAVLENPTKIAATVKWGVMGLSVLAGAGLGAGVLYGVQKWRNRKSDVVAVPDDISELDEAEKA